MIDFLILLRLLLSLLHLCNPLLYILLQLFVFAELFTAFCSNFLTLIRTQISVVAEPRAPMTISARLSQVVTSGVFGVIISRNCNERQLRLFSAALLTSPTAALLATGGAFGARVGQ